MRKPFWTMVSLLVLLAVTSPIHADEMTGPERKLGRGALNLLTGWVEIPRQIAREGAKHPLRAPFQGVGYGLWYGVQRTTYGFWDMLTFLAPPYDFPVMEPEILFEDPEPEPAITITSLRANEVSEAIS